MPLNATITQLRHAVELTFEMLKPLLKLEDEQFDELIERWREHIEKHRVTLKAVQFWARKSVHSTRASFRASV